MNAQVINDAANAAALSIMEAPPEIGNRSPGIWSVCFQGGTFDRVKQRCRLIAACHTYIDHIICLLCIVHLCNQLNHCMCTIDAPQVFWRLFAVPADKIQHVAARTTTESHRKGTPDRHHRGRTSSCSTTRHVRPNQLRSRQLFRRSIPDTDGPLGMMHHQSHVCHIVICWSVVTDAIYIYMYLYILM